MAGKSTFLICTRNVTKKGFGNEPGSTLFLRVPAKAKDYDPKMARGAKSWRKAVMSAADGVEDAITGSTGDVLVFVHGYNNSREVVLWRTRMLEKSLAEQGWRGLVVGCDWPSANSTLNYLEDRSDASKVALRLVEESLQLLIDAQKPKADGSPGCQLNVHLLGHSTGAFVINEAFAQAEKVGECFHSPWRIAQVALIGGDVSTRSMDASSDRAAPLFRRVMRLTNYSNRFDKVLGVSNAKRLGTAPRVGRVGLPDGVHRKAVNVDCSGYFEQRDPGAHAYVGTYNHSWHIGDPAFALDLALTLEGEIDREALPTRELRGGDLFLRGGQSRPAHQSHWDDVGVSI